MRSFSISVSRHAIIFVTTRAGLQPTPRSHAAGAKPSARRDISVPDVSSSDKID